MTVETRIALGKKIKKLRKASKLSQKKFSLMVNIERGYLSKIEKGKRNATIDIIEKIADGLDVSLSELFKDVDAPPGADLSGATNIPRRGDQPGILYSSGKIEPK